MTTNSVGLGHLALDQLKPHTFDHVSISVNYTVTNNNVSTLPDVASFFAERGVSVLNFHRASLVGNTYNNPELLVSPPDWVVARDGLMADLAQQQPQNYAGLTVRLTADIGLLFFRLQKNQVGSATCHQTLLVRKMPSLATSSPMVHSCGTTTLKTSLSRTATTLRPMGLPKLPAKNKSRMANYTAFRIRLRRLSKLEIRPLSTANLLVSVASKVWTMYSSIRHKNNLGMM
jgi:hypothetical protein